MERLRRGRRPLRDLTTSNIRVNQTSGDKETFTVNKTKAPKLLKQKSPLRGIAEDVDDPLLIELGPGMGSGGIQQSSCLSGPEEKLTNAVNFTASAAQGESDEKYPSTQPSSLGQSRHGRELRSRAKKQSSNVPFRDVAQRLTSNKTKSKAHQVVGDETFIISSTVEVVHTEKPATSPQTDIPQRQENVAMAEGENGEEIHDVIYSSTPSSQGESDEKSPSTQPPSLGQSRDGRELRSRAKKQSSNVPFRDVAQRLASNKTKSKARQVVEDETFIISSTVEVVHTEKPATSPQTDVPQRQKSVSMADGENGDENHDVLYFSGRSVDIDKRRANLPQADTDKRRANLPQADTDKRRKTLTVSCRCLLEEDLPVSCRCLLEEDLPVSCRCLLEEDVDYILSICVLEKEVDRLERVCAKWSSVQNSTCLPQEVSSLIDVALGQTGLLINQKFSQFRKLIDKCELKQGRLPIFLSDLEGFWDIICLQVKNIDNRFFHLEKLEVNNWQESSPEVKSFIKKKKVPILIKPEHNVKTSVKDFIEASVLASSHRDILKESHQRNKKLTPILMKVSKCAENTP
uniref:Disks large-associated protein 5 n=1 Tax=Timema poppense TaxID=170557 RepID=A0A7R9GYG3_TIMPO|nr:unnamed protein product [Timema poppensis]